MVQNTIPMLLKQYNTLTCNQSPPKIVQQLENESEKVFPFNSHSYKVISCVQLGGNSQQ